MKERLDHIFFPVISSKNLELTRFNIYNVVSGKGKMKPKTNCTVWLSLCTYLICFWYELFL